MGYYETEVLGEWQRICEEQDEYALEKYINETDARENEQKKILKHILEGFDINIIFEALNELYPRQTINNAEELFIFFSDERIKEIIKKRKDFYSRSFEM